MNLAQSAPMCLHGILGLCQGKARFQADRGPTLRAPAVSSPMVTCACPPGQRGIARVDER
jgi:hypothetical protein